MATALTSEYTRFTDKCNKVLAGGIVKTFEPNSLTPKISYQDPNKEIPNLTEVHLDETGRAKIYIDGDYRIQVYSRDGVLIEDNLLVEQTLVQRDFVELSQEIQTELQQALDQFQIDSNAAVDNLYAAITSIGGMVEDGQFKLDWAHVFNKPTTLNGYGITNAYTKSEANAAFIEDAEKGVASGVAPLDANTKVDPVYLPAATESALGAVQLVNNLTFGGMGKSLTAEMGKLLEQKKLRINVNKNATDIKATRSKEVVYTNPSADTWMTVRVACDIMPSSSVRGYVNEYLQHNGIESSSGYWVEYVFLLVPPLGNYKISGKGTVLNWSEV